MLYVDTIYRRVNRELKKPQVRRRLKLATTLLMLINLLALTASLYFIITPNQIGAATTTYTYAFATTQESWTGNGGTSTTDTYQAAAGNPAGALQSSISGRAKTNTAAGWYRSSITWEDLGVPANSVVTQVDGKYDWRCSAYTTGASSNSGALTVTDSADGNSTTLETGVAFTTTTSWATRNATTAVSIPSAIQASSSSIKLKLLGLLATSTSSSAVVTRQMDTVALTITYTTNIVTVGTNGNQNATLYINTGVAQEVGGKFSFILNQNTTNITSVKLTEQGTVDAQANLADISLYYDLDTTAPYDCASESYDGTETQFGSTVASFTASNGTATFSGSSVAVSPTQTMCVYTTLKIGAGATAGQTLVLQIAKPSTDVVASSATVTPATAVSTGSSTLANQTINVTGTTTSLSSGTVTIAINSAIQTGKTGSISGGSWTIAGVTKPASGAVITVWVSDAPMASAVTKYNGLGDETGLVLDSHTFSVGSASNQSLALSDIDLYDYNQDTNIIHRVATSILTIDPGSAFSDEKISVLTGNTLTVSGTETLTTVHLSYSGTLTSGGDTTYNVAGNWVRSGGTFTASSSTVNLNGSNGSTQVITGNTTFNNLYATATTARTINFASGSTTTVTGAWTVTGATGQNILLGRDGGTGLNQWNINPTSWSVNYVTPSNSNNQAGSPINPANYTDGTNNTNWFITNTAPTAPTSLLQKKVTGGATLNVGDWANETQVQLTATTTDPDAGDTVYLCVEAVAIGTSLTNTDGGTLCGTGVANSSPGNPIAITVTITGLTDATEFHWQAQAKDALPAYSGWTGYGGNTENPPTNPAARDFGVDTTAPTGGAVNDGQTSGGDLDWNVDGTLTNLLANWTTTAPDSGASGLSKYEYALRRQTDNNYWTPGSPGTWGAGAYWYDNTTGTSFTVNNLNLSTGVTYYITLRTTDNAGNSSTINSNGIQVTPTLSFSIGSNLVTFDDLSNINNWTNTKTTTLQTSTNAANGYTIKGYISDYLRSLVYITTTIADFAGTWTTPQDWANFCKDDAADCGFGYTSNDTLVQGSNRFTGGNNYASYSQSAPGDVLADHTDLVNGSTGAVVNETFTITHKVSVSPTQTASKYQTIFTVVCTANY